MAERDSGASKPPTIKDVARAAGVSIGAVSTVFRGAPGVSEQTRLRVLRIAEEIGYQPDSRARLLRRNKSRLVGITFLVESAFHGDLLPGIYEAAEQAGYEVTLSGWTRSRSEEHAVQTLMGFRCDAMILLGSEIPETRLLEIAARRPIVVAARRLMAPVVDCVRTDDMEGMRLAVGHLLSLGHRRIVHVDGGQHAKSLDRLRGYIEAMQALGLAEQIAVVPGGQTVDAGAEAAQRLLPHIDAYTAVIAYDDDCAWGLIAALQARGIYVPRDLSVVGYDGGRLSRLMPIAGMTTIRQDSEAIARFAVERAIELAEEGAQKPREIVLPPTLIEGGSTAAVEA